MRNRRVGVDHRGRRETDDNRIAAHETRNGDAGGGAAAQAAGRVMAVRLFYRRVLVIVVLTRDVVMMLMRAGQRGDRRRDGERERQADSESQHSENENKATRKHPHSIFGSAAGQFEQAPAGCSGAEPAATRFGSIRRAYALAPYGVALIARS